MQVVWQKGFIGLVAPKEWDAIRAAKALKVTWSDVKPPFPAMPASTITFATPGGEERRRGRTVGDVDAAFANAAKVIEAAYEWPFHSHARMAPACGLADVRDGAATIWTGSQKPHYCREGIAKMLELPVDKVKDLSMTGPGSYGRNDAGDSTMDAAVLSKAVGKPVRVQGMRYEGHGWDPKAPASIHISRAAIDKDGKVKAWDFDTKAFSRRDFLRDEGSPQRHARRPAARLAVEAGVAFGPPANPMASRHKRRRGHTIPPLLDRASPLRSSHMRDPGGPQMHFASESFMDEVALATNMDPVEFRLRYLENPRDKAVIKAAAEKANWQPRVGARKQANGNILTGQGIAYAERGATRVADHRRGRGQPQHRQGLGRAFSPWRMIAARSSRPMSCGSPSRAISCRRQPGSLGRGDVRPATTSPAWTG